MKDINTTLKSQKSCFKSGKSTERQNNRMLNPDIETLSKHRLDLYKNKLTSFIVDKVFSKSAAKIQSVVS